MWLQQDLPYDAHKALAGAFAQFAPSVESGKSSRPKSDTEFKFYSSVPPSFGAYPVLTPTRKRMNDVPRFVFIHPIFQYDSCRRLAVIAQ
jgi:hypothetical protein